MPPDSFPEISLGTAALAIFLFCAGFVLLRGATRLLVGTVVLAASLWAGFEVWQSAPSLLHGWNIKPQPWLINALVGATFLLTFFLLRKITRTIANPLRKEGSGSRTVLGTGLRLVLSLIPTSLIWLVGAAAIHHFGSVAELRDHTASTEKSPTHDFLLKLHSAVASAIPASWLAKLDPSASPDRVKLAKLITTQSAHPPATDPVTGKPIPRARIVEDPDLQNLAREGNFSTLLRHPALTKALQDPKIQNLLRDLNL
ncbi:MAG: hypothetical protein V4640_09585 [Verrucomicrobiota bacterium]